LPSPERAHLSRAQRDGKLVPLNSPLALVAYLGNFDDLASASPARPWPNAAIRERVSMSPPSSISLFLGLSPEFP
jgi:hypothetical protein